MGTTNPVNYQRRILLAVTGLSPQILTETLYALAIRQTPAFTPTEIHLVTTEPGAERARLNLLHSESGWFHRLRKDYGLHGVHFDAGNIHVITDADGAPLDDIRTPVDNECTANALTEWVRHFTANQNCALHISIAGGRKTMGFYAGYALSLYGRPQDRLSHVLVSTPYESHPDFYYPTPYSRVIHTFPPDSRPLDTKEAEVTLAEIPFVRMRDGLSNSLLAGSASFSDTVDSAQRALDPPELVIDQTGRRIQTGDRSMHLPPAELAFYSWFARSQLNAGPGILCPAEGAPDSGYAQSFLREYRFILGEMGDDESTVRRLAGGMDKTFFEQRKSKLHKSLNDHLDLEAKRYLIDGEGQPKRYALGLDASEIRFAPIDVAK